MSETMEQGVSAIEGFYAATSGGSFVVVLPRNFKGLRKYANS